MVRTQIRITEQQAAALRSISADRRRSVAELIRLSIDSFLQREADVEAERKRAKARSAAGRFASSVSHVNSEHDKYLAEAMGQA